MGSFEDFAVNSLHVHATHEIYTMGMVYKPGLSNTYCRCRPLELAVVNKAMPTSKISPWSEFIVDSAA